VAVSKITVINKAKMETPVVTISSTSRRARIKDRVVKSRVREPVLSINQKNNKKNAFKARVAELVNNNTSKNKEAAIRIKNLHKRSKIKVIEASTPPKITA